jgi:hypothetical protein
MRYVRLTEEEVIGIGAEAADLEYLNHVEELAMDIADYRHRGGNMDHIAFLHQ